MLTLADFFCGAGGSSTGAAQVPDVQVSVAANHWSRAIETHSLNHPGAEHILADLSQIDPRVFPRTDLAWFSPSCTNHSAARGRLSYDEAAERSRATMWDVVRFSEHHAYDAVIVENVIDVCRWAPYRAWLDAMRSLGYLPHVVSLNSMHAGALGPAAAQSRDRFYAIFTRTPIDVAPSPYSRCPSCCAQVCGVQTWRRADRDPMVAGRYGRQYDFTCPTCHGIVEPEVLPASSIIDWSIPGQRIGERPKPLAPATRARVAAGIARYWGRGDTAFVAHLRGSAPTQIAGSHSPISDPMHTIAASGNHHALIMRNFTGGAEMTTPVSEPIRTITAAAHQSLITADDIEAAARDVDDAYFRMLEPAEAKNAMAFPAEYVLLGNRREQVKQAGNAVTPPAARDLVAAVVDTLGAAA